MSDDSAQKQDEVDILKLSAQYDMGDHKTARKVLQQIQASGLTASSLGQLYIERLAQISAGTNPQSSTCPQDESHNAADGIVGDASENHNSDGKPSLEKNSSSQANAPKTDGNSSVVTDTMQKFANKINAIAGGEGNVELRVRDLFKDVFKRHTTEEAEKIFICGTESTTPATKVFSSSWPAPWLYSRVAIYLFVAFLILKYAWSLTENPLLLPNIMFIGACIVPFSIMIFFFETNVPQNISIFKVVLIFFVGGCASLLCTLILFEIVPDGILSFFGATMIGIVEETGKMLIVAFFISRMRDCVYILNGMLVGSAVGAGFAAFESAGYAFSFFANNGYAAMTDTINIRALTAPGGHIVWAATAGAAIMIAMRGQKFEWGVIRNVRFLRLFILPIILHATWDMPIGNTALKYPILIAISWIIILVLLYVGLKEVQKQSSIS